MNYVKEKGGMTDDSEVEVNIVIEMYLASLSHGWEALYRLLLYVISHVSTGTL